MNLIDQTDRANPLDCVHSFMLTGKQSTKGFNLKQAGLYFGLQLEEVDEKVELFIASEPDAEQREALTKLHELLKHFSKRFKSGCHLAALQNADRHKMIDADINMAWVSLGALFSTATEPGQAFMAVAEANFAKFHNGVAIFDENGKIQKPEGWREPNMLPFVDTSDQEQF